MSVTSDTLASASSVEFVQHVERLRQVLASLNQSNPVPTSTSASTPSPLKSVLSDRTHLTINVPETSPAKTGGKDSDELQAALVDAGFSPLPVRPTRRPAVVTAPCPTPNEAFDAEQAALEAALEQTKRTIHQLSLEVELLARENHPQEAHILSPSSLPSSSTCEQYDSPRRNVPFYSVALSGFLSPLMETSRDNILDQSSDQAMSENMIAST